MDLPQGVTNDYLPTLHESKATREILCSSCHCDIMQPKIGVKLRFMGREIQML